MNVTVNVSADAPVALGSLVRVSATTDSTGPSALRYRFRVRPAGRSYFHTVVDFGPKRDWNWTTIDGEGSYDLRVDVRDSSTGETGSATAPVVFSPLATGTEAVITPSANPLVAIYSAPACAAGSRMRVQFQTQGESNNTTPWKACSEAHTMNFYLAGMHPGTPYAARYVIDDGKSMSFGQRIALLTDPVPVAIGKVNALTPAPLPSAESVLLQSVIGGTSFATDLAGNVIWFAPSDISFITRPQAGGTFLAIFEDQTQDPAHQFFREFDLAGITVAETNAARVNEQLAAMGINPINCFHHEVRKLPNGGYLVLAASERIMSGVQGNGTVDIIGDTILVLNSALQVTWAWDSFDHLDVTRAAILGERCMVPNGGCPPIYKAALANDWLHGNALQLTPDGNILYSSRHQDWVIKIAYQNGAGSGDVIWRLGNQGDFQYISTDAYPWFSHQHDSNFESDGVSLTLFDDGNVRVAAKPGSHSRGQAWQIDEQNRTATLVLNADVGSYSAAVGSAQKLPSGNYHFDSGFIMDGKGNLSSQSVEVTPEGVTIFGISIASIEYRSFRLSSLYSGQ